MAFDVINYDQTYWSYNSKLDIVVTNAKELEGFNNFLKECDSLNGTQLLMYVFVDSEKPIQKVFYAKSDEDMRLREFFVTDQNHAQLMASTDLSQFCIRFKASFNQWCDLPAQYDLLHQQQYLSAKK
ncbi:hypothetical protein [Parashewanella tropica]|uniref:hypothetical protein n=1 Tax=Parashewanella tropica TaxID=2547970 RepID=UPI00105965C3|nr:hypothetical protein [Parashewanella tropica]